ncbi:MAG TPA: DNA-binding protein [Candidatus Hodarchaeales archaeon]|nr:DNA-binding protein [Candidatus Hodarchaeales archaeon]
MSNDEEIARLRAQRQQDLQRQAEAKAQQDAQQQALEAQKALILATFLTEEARTRLANIKLANPEYASQLESRLISIYQSGQLRGKKITDDQLKNMLRQLMASRKETKINIQRK